MFVASFFVLLLATVRCVAGADPACCNAVSIYQPDLIPPQVGIADCEANRAGLGPFDNASNGEWVIQNNWITTDAARFLIDFGTNGTYWRYADGQRVPGLNQILSFYTASTPGIVFPNPFTQHHTSITACADIKYSLSDVAINANFIGAAVIVVDPSVNAEWQTWFNGAWADAITSVVPKAPLIVVPRSSASYEVDVLTGMASIYQTDYGDCQVCSVTTLDAAPPITTVTTTTSVTTTVAANDGTGVATTVAANAGTGVATTAAANAGTGVSTTAAANAGTGVSTTAAANAGTGVAPTAAIVASNASAVSCGVGLMASVAAALVHL